METSLGDFAEQVMPSTTGLAMTHMELCAIVESRITEMLQNDPILHDLPEGVTNDEVQACIAVEHGQSITCHLHREPYGVVPISIVRTATVGELKSAIEVQLSRHIQRTMDCTSHISWKYIWRAYTLKCDGMKLLKNHRAIRKYGLKHKCHLDFVKLKKSDKYERRKRSRSRSR